MAIDTNSFNARELYDIYKVKIQFRDKVCGGVPKNPQILKSWIVSATKFDDAISTQQEKDAREAILAPTEEKSWNGFLGDEALGLFLETRQVKALFKEAATMLRVTTSKLGSKQIFQHGFEIKPGGEGRQDRLYLGRKTADGMNEGPIHVQTAQGPRTALKRVDYAHKAILEFEVWVLTTAAAENRHVGEHEIRVMLTFGQENGIGADRSQGHGKFDVVSFAKIQSGELAFSKKEKEPKPGKAKKGEDISEEAAE